MTDGHFGSYSDTGCQTADTVINYMLENLPLLCQVISTQILRKSVSVPNRVTKSTDVKSCANKFRYMNSNFTAKRFRCGATCISLIRYRIQSFIETKIQ